MCRNDRAMAKLWDMCFVSKTVPGRAYLREDGVCIALKLLTVLSFLCS